MSVNIFLRFTRIPIRGCELHLTALRLEEAKKHARSRRNGFYEALGVPQSSRMVDIKQAYLRIAKKHHPDRAGHENTESREIFDEASEAYQCLIDPSQRHFYDQHGYPSDELRKKGMPSIFDYKPRFSIYEAQMRTDSETNAVEDWFKAQGHSVNEPNIGIRQRLKNIYVELRFGFKYFDFPWNPKEFAIQIMVAVSISFFLVFVLMSYVRYKIERLQPGDPTLPAKLNELWNSADNQNDILGYLGLRPKKLKPWEEVTEKDKPKEKKVKKEVPNIQELQTTWKERRKQHRLEGLRHRLNHIESEAERIRATIRRIESDD